MTFDKHANFAISSISVAPYPATSGTTLTVVSGTGMLFPLTPFNLVISPHGQIATSINSEIVRVTAKNGDIFTVQRAIEQSTIRAILIGDSVNLAITSKLITDLENAINNIDAVQVVTGTLDPARLPIVNNNIGTFGDATNVPQITVNNKGQVTSVTLVEITGGGNSIGTLQMSRDVYGNYYNGLSNARFKDNVGWQFYNEDTNKWHTLLCTEDPPTLAFDDGTGVSNTNSNARFVDGQGLQVYNQDTGIWHTILCIQNPPTLAFDDGTINIGTANIRFKDNVGWQIHNTTTTKWHTLMCTDNPPVATFDSGSL